MLIDEGSKLIKDLMCSDKFLADGFRGVCAEYLKIGPHSSPEFVQQYGAPATRLKSTIDALTTYVANTSVTLMISQTFVVDRNEFEINDDSPLLARTLASNKALAQFAERYGNKGIDDFFLVDFFDIRLFYIYGAIFTLVGDQCFLIGSKGLETEKMRHSEGIHYLVAAIFSYELAERFLINSLSSTRQSITALSNYFDESARSGTGLSELFAMINEWGRMLGFLFELGHKFSNSSNKEKALAPYVASEILLFDVIESVRFRLALFEPEAEA